MCEPVRNPKSREYQQGEKLKADQDWLRELDSVLWPEPHEDSSCVRDILMAKAKNAKAAEAECDGLKAQLARTAIPTHPQTAAQLLAASLNASEEKVKALEQRIACAKVCSHIYTRVALTSTTTCPACTRGIVWPQPAERIAAPLAAQPESGVTK